MEEKNEEKTIDIKGTIEKFINADEPEMTQEEAIINYEEQSSKKKYSDTDSDWIEEQEHLQRVKKELLASLERVKKLEKEIYNEHEQDQEKNKLKVKSGGGKQHSDESSQSIRKTQIEQKERE